MAIVLLLVHSKYVWQTQEVDIPRIFIVTVKQALIDKYQSLLVTMVTLEGDFSTGQLGPLTMEGRGRGPVSPFDFKKRQYVA